MCGIVGVLNLRSGPPVDLAVLSGMLEVVHHRGPDGRGIYRDADVGMGSARLSIIDLGGGDQPIGNEDGTLWIVFNGEIFNYVELRPELESRGHRFATDSDTEVILHLYEDLGPGCLERLNGQFTIAIWDQTKRSLFLARDRLGVRPLYYATHAGTLVFASEIKALLCAPGIRAEIDTGVLRQVFTYWNAPSPRTVFQGIQEVPPAHYLLIREGTIQSHAYWQMDFSVPQATNRSPEDCLDEFRDLLIDATRIRLRADVPVGAYVSGGLDSAITAAIIRSYTGNRLDTFSIAFDDPEFDEAPFQRRVAKFLGTEHQVVTCSYADIGRVFPEVVWHAETPLLRTAPAPMFLLSKQVHQAGYKVVITGEGADEFLAGYDLFKEAKIRAFWAKDPSSEIRPLLLRRLYPDIPGMAAGQSEFLAAFYRRTLADPANPYYSHAVRWETTRRNLRFLRSEHTGDPVGERPETAFPLPEGIRGWTALARAQYLEVTTFLSPYLLSSQGDRMAMAHSVEGRFPYLDTRIVEFCNRLPDDLKMRALRDKWILRRLGGQMIPKEIWMRPKKAYRAPIQGSFFGPESPEYVNDLLSETSLRDGGLLEPAPCLQLARKASSGIRLTEVEGMALVGILSTQLLHHQFIRHFRPPSAAAGSALKLVDVVHPRQGPRIASEAPVSHPGIRIDRL
jgi:asparagine synthase (glutamine-hydrolysing)